MDRDHWAFGAGWVFSLALIGLGPALTFFERAAQSSDLSWYSCRREGALARDLTLAMGL